MRRPSPASPCGVSLSFYRLLPGGGCGGGGRGRVAVFIVFSSSIGQPRSIIHSWNDSTAFEIERQAHSSRGSSSPTLTCWMLLARSEKIPLDPSTPPRGTTSECSSCRLLRMEPSLWLVALKFRIVVLDSFSRTGGKEQINYLTAKSSKVCFSTFSRCSW